MHSHLIVPFILMTVVIMRYNTAWYYRQWWNNIQWRMHNVLLLIETWPLWSEATHCKRPRSGMIYALVWNKLSQKPHLFILDVQMFTNNTMAFSQLCYANHSTPRHPFHNALAHNWKLWKIDFSRNFFLYSDDTIKSWLCNLSENMNI